MPRAARLLVLPFPPNPEDLSGFFLRRGNLKILPLFALTITLQACSVGLPRCKIFLRRPSPGATWEGYMSFGPQVSPAITYRAALFENNSSDTSRSRSATALSCPSVLLVGRNGSWGTMVLKSLEKFEAELFFMPPQSVTAELVRKSGYNLILLDSTVSPEQRRQLASRLVGSSASIFYTFPVENGCWWLPTLRHGEDCHGTPAFRRNEFPYELERILQDQTEA